MGNAVATRDKGSSVATASDNPWLAAAADSNDFAGTYFKLNGNSGEYLAGQAGDEIDAGTKMAVNMSGAKHGYLCWVDGAPVDRAMLLVEHGDKPDLTGLKDYGPYTKHPDGTQDGWGENHQLPMANGDDELYMFQASSKSAVTSVKRFYTEYGKKRSQHVDDDGNYMIPVVELDVGSFVSKANKKAGKKYFPILKIVDWVSAADLADVFDAVTDEDGGDDPENYADKAAETAPAEKRTATTTKKGGFRKTKPAETEVAEEPEAEVAEEAETTTTTKASTNAAAAEGRRGKRF